jgi:Tfp pilus assembly protein PilF
MTDATDLERATALLRDGKPADAARVLGALLSRQPRHAIAAHLMGLALKDTGDWGQGEEWLRFSIGLEPGRGEFHANLGNLLRKREKYAQAEESYRQALRLLPGHRAARRGLAQTLTDLNRPAEAEEHCRTLLTTEGSDAEAWEILALALTALGRTAEAESAHRRAIALDPDDAVAQHNLGALLVRLERPEAMAALDAARKLGADGYEAAYNRGRAALNAGDLEDAEAAFARAEQLQPLDLEVQRTLASIRFMRGDPAFARSLGAVVRANRDNVPLQGLLAELLWRSGELAGAETLLRDVLEREKSDPAVRSTLAMVLMDQGRLDEAETEALEAAAMGKADGPGVALNLVNILLMRGRPEEAQPFIAAQLRRDPWAQAWLACEATAARMLGQERYGELYDYDRFVRAFDLEPPPGFGSMAEFNQTLAAVLNDRHRFTRHPLDQTLRNGTQTSRSLLTDPDPVVQSALKAFEAAVEEYRQGLALPSDHPLAFAKRGAIKFTGAWSVRLQRNGFHVNHYHPEGMVSSAYYVEVPGEVRDPALKSGWIKFGEPRYPVAGLTPERFVQPTPGRLVLFPSYMWHGTNPIFGPEARMCIAFDMRPQR